MLSPIIVLLVQDCEYDVLLLSVHSVLRDLVAFLRLVMFALDRQHHLPLVPRFPLVVLDEVLDGLMVVVVGHVDGGFVRLRDIDPDVADEGEVEAAGLEGQGVVEAVVLLGHA